MGSDMRENIRKKEEESFETKIKGFVTIKLFFAAVYVVLDPSLISY
jgi:hypothetical protein